jgi:YD repeat-containing protein
MFVSVVAHRSPLRIILALTICAALLLVPNAVLVHNGAYAQGQNQSSKREGRPRPGKPEVNLPDLEDVQNESHVQREPAAPIPSTLRSPRVPLQPWNGRRVGDPGTRGELGQSRFRGGRIRRAHAYKNAVAPTFISDDQFITNFFTYAVLRSPGGDEPTFWRDQLRVAHGQGSTSLKLAAVELGKTLFESAEYDARERNPSQYVSDLYWTYLMRAPDSGGWAHWTGEVGNVGRENVRRAFEECSEFAGILASIVPNGSPTANAASLISARVNPRNQPGNGMLTRDGTWSITLLSLPGRAGLDLGLGLSYSSAVWTRSGPYIHFDEDNGFPSPGFRLGFPVVQRKVFDAQTVKNTFLLITAAGDRVELRQVGTSNTFETGDSSYLQLVDNSPNLILRSTDGTQLSFVEINNEYSCTQVKDRNGNFITINHNALGRITSVTETLGRVINFNYDVNQNLLSITQSWNGQPSHQWVAFNWSTRTMQSSFSGAAVIGPKNGTQLPVITGVTLNDTSQVTFDYTNSLQVYLIRDYFGALQRSETTFTYETPGSDVPRLTDSRISAHNWTGVNGVPSQVITTYSVAGDGACVMTAPDGTIYKQYYGTGWQRGLTTLSEVWSGGVRQKWTTMAWTQDSTSVGYEVNPRVTETNVYDAGGNRRRTVIDYGPYWQWGLPYVVKEYAADASTEIRHTYTDYNLSQTYLDRRIIGLVSEVHLTNVSQYQSKITYSYDDPARLQSVPAAATQHDSAYSTSLTARGNVTAVSRWDVTDINNASKKLTSYTNYYTTGSPVSSTDASGHQSSVAYADAFSDTVNRNTYAYPTTVTDAGGFSSNIQYNFDFGAITRTQSPAPAGQLYGAIQVMTYNSLGQLERVATSNNGAYKRFWHGADFSASYATVNNVVDESYSIQTFDGVGRILGAASNHPGSNGGYSAQINVYDSMGRVKKISNPAEITSSWVPAGDDNAGWLYTQQTYDWQGRPLVTTNPDNTTKEASYGGCGCAGGQVVTLTDEGTIDAGVAKRQTKIYSDVLGRTVKTEILNWQGGSVYSATVDSYNARDQVTQVREYAGAEGSGTYQDTTMSYDGYGRLKTKHVPEQSAGTSSTWDYNADNTIQKVTDARGASQTFGYNSRHFVTSINYGVPGGSGITVPAAATFVYDAAGNRTSMTDGAGTVSFSYDQISRLTSETRHFSELVALPGSGNYTLAYQYNLADTLTSLTQPSQFSGTVNYAYDSAARLVSVSGAGFGTTTQFASNIQYRAWGGIKQMSYGSGATLNLTYTPRLLPMRYELGNMKPNGGPATIMGSQNEYFGDGRVKYTQDLQDGNFDRAYEYDHAGRIKEAYSGREARGLPVLPYPDNPFRQSYTYDVWNNMKRPANRHWSAGLLDNPTYTNNRRTDATYDAAGNITVRDNWRKQHAYDAVGRQSYFLQQEWNLPNYLYEANTIQVTYDGNGRPAKRFQNRHIETYEEMQWDEPSTIYYVRSTLLDGAPIIELETSAGYGATENIYMGLQKIASHGTSNYVQWRHVNPATGSWLVSSQNPGGALAFRNELDPLGTEMGTSDPYVSYTSYQDLIGLESLYEERGNPFDPSGGCGTLDGLPISCSEMRMRMQGGSVAREMLVPLEQPVGTSTPNETTPYTTVLTVDRQPIASLGAGLYLTVVPTIKGGRVNANNNNEGFYYLDWTEEVFTEQQRPGTDYDKILGPPPPIPKLKLGDSLTRNQAVLDNLYCLWKRGGYGFQPTEQAEWITENNGQYGSTPWPSSSTVAQASWKGPVPAGAIAQAHTHPEITSKTSSTGPKPSTSGGNTGRGDHGTADKLGMPVYVVTRNAIWKAVPNAKDPVQVAGKDWWKPSEKAKVKCK